MKFLKQSIVILLLLTLCLGAFTACFGSEESTEGPTAETPTGDTPTGDTPTEKPGDNTEEEYKTITIAQALELCGDEGNITKDRYYIRATVKTISNVEYGQMVIKDDTGEIEVYGTFSADGAKKFNELEKTPHKGDEVLLYCILQNYGGTKEVKNAWLIEFKEIENPVDETLYTDMSIADAREAKEGTLVKVDGVVAQITYAFGKVPSGVYLVDDTNSIYVYDRDLAQRVAIGNSVTILANKTYWVLEKEQSSADRHGYLGCCQLENAIVKSIDTTTSEYNKSWIKESTIKEILETPVTENITTTIYKVNALVKKNVGSNFVNYYFDDLDGVTGSYTYTQCSGADFSWIDEFDGKICTVYLSVINAKAEKTGCTYRFLPVEIVDEGFEFDVKDAPAHTVKYYGVDQFESKYMVNPELELIGSVSSELLGFENATLTYSSNNEASVYFTELNGKTILNCGEAGKATVTITGTYGTYTYSETVEIEVIELPDYDTVTVAEAQTRPVGDRIIIRGIVGPSLVNRDGFYLFDETGMIAVIVNNTSIFGSIEIGNEIYISAKRDCFKDAAKTHAGQTCLTEGDVLVNLYGNHDYPTDDFITDKTLADLYNLDVNVDYSTNVYVVKATVNYVDAGYYTKINLKDGSTEFSLYCSSANQYGFLIDFAGQEVILEIAPCNWNNKTYYTGCVLAVYTEDGKILNELNFG